MRLHRFFLVLLYAVGLGTVAYFAFEGRDYYLTPLIERPRHPDYWLRKPGGTLGHAFGVAGATLMMLMLLYSVRRRVAALRRAGPLRVWLDLHIFCGVVGPLLIVLHSSFKVGGLVGLSFWSMVAVALSGVLGRYLYLQLPRSRAGDELTLEQTDAVHRALTDRLSRELGFGQAALAELDGVIEASTDPRRSLLVTLLRLPFEALALRWSLRRYLQKHAERTPRLLRAPVARTVRRKAMLHRRILLSERLQELFHYWHVVHKPFAIVMYLFMLVHILVVTATGYGWSR